MVLKLLLALLVAANIAMSTDIVKDGTANDVQINESTEMTEPVDGSYGEDLNYDAVYSLVDIAIFESDEFAKASVNKDYDKIENLLKNLVETSQYELYYAYFGDESGYFKMYPDEQLPEEYDFRERPTYTSALEEDVFISEPYEDFITGRAIVTVAVSVYVDDTLIGVLGVDVYVN